MRNIPASFSVGMIGGLVVTSTSVYRPGTCHCGKLVTSLPLPAQFTQKTYTHKAYWPFVLSDTEIEIILLKQDKKNSITFRVMCIYVYT